MSAILGIMGKAGSGKDTVADHIVAYHGFVKMSLADEMKRFTKLVFGFSDQQLWGPSQCRNEADVAYNDPDRWDVAEDALFKYGRSWCEFLFGVERVGEAWGHLLEWFDDLRFTYGVDFGKKNTFSPRVALQTVGTEFGRSIDQNVWVRSTLDIAQKVLTGPYSYTRSEGLKHDPDGWGQWWQNPKGVVIPDCRFKNEVDGVQNVGGRILRVKRPGAEKVVPGVAGHASEAEQDSIPDSACDYVFVSPEGLAVAQTALEGLTPTIIGGLK